MLESSIKSNHAVDNLSLPTTPQLPTTSGPQLPTTPQLPATHQLPAIHQLPATHQFPPTLPSPTTHSLAIMPPLATTTISDAVDLTLDSSTETNVQQHPRNQKSSVAQKQKKVNIS